MLYSGARKPRNLRAFALRNSAKSSGLPRAAPTLSFMSRTLRSGRFSATTFLANSLALVRSSPSGTSSSSRPLARAVLASMCLPEVIISSACSTPTRRGSRCVPPAPGNRPRFTSGRPHLADGYCDSIVACHGNFEPAAQGCAMNCSDDRLGRTFEGIDHFRERRRHGRLGKLRDVGAGKKRLAIADEYDDFDRGVCNSLIDALADPVAHLLRQRIHRRRIERQDANVAFDGERGHGVDSPHQCVSHDLRLNSPAAAPVARIRTTGRPDGGRIIGASARDTACQKSAERSVMPKLTVGRQLIRSRYLPKTNV